jgi:hypothetical protein
MPAEALAVIKFESAEPARPRAVEALYALNALQDADKHRNMLVLVAGIIDPEVRISWADEAMRILTPRYVAPGEELVRYDEIGNRIPYSEVTVDVRGVPEVGVTISGQDDFRLLHVAGGILGRVRERVIPSLEPFART